MRFYPRRRTNPPGYRYRTDEDEDISDSYEWSQ
jgi:hypothetical protein